MWLRRFYQQSEEKVNTDYADLSPLESRPTPELSRAPPT
jgi:hypothetical protein